MLFIHTHRLSRAPTERRGRVDGASLPQEGPEPEPYQPGHDEQRDKQERPLVELRQHRIYCKERTDAGLYYVLLCKHIARTRNVSGLVGFGLADNSAGNRCWCANRESGPRNKGPGIRER